MSRHIVSSRFVLPHNPHPVSLSLNHPLPFPRARVNYFVGRLPGVFAALKPRANIFCHLRGKSVWLREHFENFVNPVYLLGPAFRVDRVRSGWQRGGMLNSPSLLSYLLVGLGVFATAAFAQELKPAGNPGLHPGLSSFATCGALN